MKAPLLIISFCLISLPSQVTQAQNIYKCTDQDGQTLYSDQACPKKAPGKLIKLKAPSYSKKTWQEKQAAEKARLAKIIKTELNKCGNFSYDYIVTKGRWFAEVGMSKNEVEYIMGKTYRKNKRSSGFEQWVYRVGYGAHYIYFQNDCVVSWQK